MIGAIIGDMIGSVYEWNNIKTKDFPLFSTNSRYTDDTIMTLAVAEILQKEYYNDKNKIAYTLRKWGRAYPYAGYGGMFARWLISDTMGPYNSYGNGSAMRVSACGWYGNSIEEVTKLATLVTEVTHNHQDGIKGAVVVACSIYYARIGKSKEFIREYVSKYYNIDFNYEELRKNYTFDVTCAGSVPEAIYSFLISNSFVDCLRIAISIGGDSDTIGAIAGGIAEAYYKDIDKEIIKEMYNRLPMANNECDAKQIITNFTSYKRKINILHE